MSTPVLLLITSSGLGGAEGIVRDLARGLPAHGFTPHVGSLRNSGPIAEELRGEGFPVFSLGMRDEAHLPEILRALPRLAREFDDRAIPLVHAALYRANVMAPLAARLASIRPRVITSQHSVAPMTGRGASFALRRVMHLSDATIAVCAAARDAAIEREGQAATRVHTIPNAVDTQRFRPRDRAEARARFGIPAGTLVVGTLGRLSAAKALHDLVDAFRLVAPPGEPRSPDRKLVIAGDGEERQSLEEKVHSLGLSANVQFLGAQAHPEEVLPAFDLFALSSREEAAPVAILEAMACGLPCVATDVGGIAESIQPGESGLLVPPENPAALAEAIRTLFDSPAQRVSLGDAAREAIRDTRSLESMIADHAALYRSVLEERKAA